VTRHLTRTDLELRANLFGFNADVPFDIPVRLGNLELPYGDLELARTAAGFENVTLSPLGAAYLAEQVASGGEKRRLHVVARTENFSAPPRGRVLGSSMRPWTARQLTRMMEVTVQGGTSYEAFADDNGQSVLKDIRRLVQDGATHITFGDPDFLNGPGHSMKILRAMHAEFPRLTFDFTAKIEHILQKRSLFPELRRLGCLFVISAVESFSDTVLDRLKKGHTRADVIEALGIVRAVGITLRPSLVAFTPWTTLDDYLDMFEMAAAHDLVGAIDPVQYTIRLLVPPGSALLDQSDIRTFSGDLDQPNFQYHWSHPDIRMDRLHELATTAVQEGTRAGEDPEALFDRLRALSYKVADRREPEVCGRVRGKQPTPRMTEPWFCCAEPTDGQFRPLDTKNYAKI